MDTSERELNWEIIDDLKDNQWTELHDDDKCFPIAIVGIACRFPGAVDVQEYRKVLLEQLRTYKPISDQKWNREEWHSGSGPYKKGYINCDVIGNTVTQLALDNAGITQATIPHKTGVYVSTSVCKLPTLFWGNGTTINPYFLTGCSHSVAANRINFFYDVNGPSIGIEAGCSSALNNIHLALQSLWNDECKAVIAGGVNCMWVPQYQTSACEMGDLSQRGEARPFDKSADGKIRSEGCGVVVLKPLKDAIRDGDHVHGIIRASVSGYHGDSLDMTVGNVESISEVMLKLYQRTGISPDNVDYVETSASGNPKDDILEAEVISKVFSKRKNPIKIGSCKANIGHAEHASGMASLIKSTMMLSSREYYPQANFSEFNSSIPAHKWNLEIQKKYEKYDSPKPMLIGINSVSTTGQVVHVILEEFKNNESDISADDLSGWHFGVSGEKGRKVVVVLSAKSKAALKAMATQWLRYKNIKDDAQIVASWLASKRNHYKHRLIIITNSGDDFREKIQDFLEGCPNDQVIEGTAPVQFQRPKICFVFPGQGQQWEDMGRSLYANEPVYKDVIDKCDEIWKNEGGYSFLETFRIFIPRDTKDGSHPSIHEMIVCPPAIVAHQVALSTLLQHWGIKPDMVIGHSLGEVAAAYVAGTINFEECMINIFHRASNQCKMSGTGAMAAARLTPEEGERFCLDYDNVYVACYNSSDNVTLSGGNDIIKRLAEENPKKIKVIRVKAPCHTIALRAVRDDFFDRLKGKYEPKMSNHITIYSTVTKDIYHGPHGTEYWWNNIEKPVFFVQANEAIFRDHGNDVIFVEIAAAPTLLSSIRQTAKKLGINPAGYVSFGGRGVDDWVAAVKGILQLYLMEFPINWENITRNCARYVDIPQYPFQKNELFFESEMNNIRRLGKHDKSYKGRYGEIDVEMHPFLTDCKFNNNALMPAAAWIEYLIEMSDQIRPCLTQVKILKTPKLFSMNNIGQFEKLCVESVVSDGKIRFQANANAWNISSDQEPGIYATAIYSDPDNREWSSKLAISSIVNRCNVHIEGNRIYEILSNTGWQYGDSFKVVKEMSFSDKEAIGLLAPGLNKYERIQTVTLDGAFQIIQISFAEANIPHKIKSVDHIQLNIEALPLNEPLYAYTKLVERSRCGFSVNIYISDTVGNILATLTGCFLELNTCRNIPSLFPHCSCFETQSSPQSTKHGNRENQNDCDIVNNMTKRNLKLKELRELKYVGVKNWKYYENERFIRCTSRNLKPTELEVVPKAFSEAGDVIQCCGNVCRVGKDVSKWKIGDRLLSLHPALIQSQQIFEEDALVSIKNMSWEEGSGICLTYGIALYIVNDLMQVKANDNVCITDCTSSIGKACAWLAHLEGARVQSRESGNIPFVEPIGQCISRNNKENLDVIICSGGTDMFIGDSRCASQQSRVCLITYSSDVDAATVTDENILTYCVNVKYILRHHSSIIRNNTVKVIKMLEEGVLPKLVFNSSVITSDESETSEDVHTITLPDNFTPDEVNRLELSLDSSKTYLISGDFNNITFALLDWLERHGAKYVALMCKPQQKRKYHNVEPGRMAKVDLTLYELETDLHCKGQLLKRIEQLKAMGAPPIGGVWHVTDVRLGWNTNEASFSEDIQTDLIDALLFYRECGSLDLDYFVTLSSADVHPGKVTSGQPKIFKQYAFLAEERKQLGLPALSISLLSLRNTSTDNHGAELPVHSLIDAMEMILVADDSPASVIIVNKDEVDDSWNQGNDVSDNSQRKETIIRYLSDELLIPNDHFDDDIPLKTYGVDNIFGKNLITWLQDELGLYATLEDIANNITLAALLAKV
ncbi:hypothetical protein LSH36_1013g01039 [Paralvinella palmiformis]|uniref:Polyketide synthase n=1 Tax=Paralvinella palmiformis TaxID=53620 RepID=A0AAD9MT12_9ANNE|nr:hypothetical protein LSH36_1013g01039 [Paralvinella palmiformis]